MTDEDKRDKRRNQRKAWYRADPDRVWRYNLKKLYGITEADYAEMLESQNGACSICHASPGDKRLSVDHCHDTGSVRGLLCNTCNTGIGLLKHKPDLLQAAASYCERLPWKMVA